MRRTSSRLLLLAMATALIATACGTDDTGTQAGETETAMDTESPTGGETGARVEGGTVVFGADQEPAIMNPILTEGNLFANGLIATAVLQGAYTITPDFQYVPQLLEGEAEVVSEDPFTVEWKIHPDATWADGTPVTSADFAFTNSVINDESLDIVSRSGHELITEEEEVDDKTYRATFSEPFAPYRTIFSPVLPAHDLEGQDLSTYWNDTITLGSGPYQVDTWQKGQQLTLTKNADFWGETKPSIDEIVIRFIEDSQSQVQALRGGEIDMFYPQPQPELVQQVDEIDGVTFEVSDGPVYEHLDLNFGNPALALDHVRKAIAHGIDRQAIVDQLIVPMKEDASVLNNVMFMSNQDQYEPHWDQYDYNPETATALHEDNGGTMGDNSIYTCDGNELSFGFVFTAGNEARQLQFEIIQAQLAEIGIDMQDESGEAATVFGEVLVSSEWDAFAFAWVGNPDPVGNVEIFKCDGSQNFQNYCNEEVTSLLEQTNSTIDQQQRFALFNEADALMADDMPLLPLYQKPSMLAWNNKIQGPKDNTTTVGPFWNIEEWYLTE
ncbi:MAG: ABC transporter family substrate-binding protein [Nitriliruptorales bacterium]|nr:ABC transporter family substrate-binding protein [Nitriliruptorales bacterium]